MNVVAKLGQSLIILTAIKKTIWLWLKQIARKELTDKIEKMYPRKWLYPQVNNETLGGCIINSKYQILKTKSNGLYTYDRENQ